MFGLEFLCLSSINVTDENFSALQYFYNTFMSQHFIQNLEMKLEKIESIIFLFQK